MEKNIKMFLVIIILAGMLYYFSAEDGTVFNQYFGAAQKAEYNILLDEGNAINYPNPKNGIWVYSTGTDLECPETYEENGYFYDNIKCTIYWTSSDDLYSRKTTPTIVEQPMSTKCYEKVQFEHSEQNYCWMTGSNLQTGFDIQWRFEITSATKTIIK